MEETTTEAPQTEGAEVQDVSTSTQPESVETVEAVEDTKPEETNTEGVEDWAKTKGLDLSKPEDVKKAFANFKAAEKKMHDSTAQASELKNVVNEEAQAAMQAAPQDDQTAQMQAQLQAIQANQAVQDFFQATPEAKKYDQQMAELVKENPALANGGMEALYAVALKRDMENGGQEELKKEGGKEALQELAQKQQAASPTPSATNMATAPAGITRQEVSERTRNGDTAWLFKHSKEIDSLTAAGL